MKEEHKGAGGLILAAVAGGAAVWAWLRQKQAAQPASQPQVSAELELATELARQRRPEAGQRVPATRKSFNLSTTGDNLTVSGARGYRLCIYEFNLYNPSPQDIDIREGPDSIQALPDFPGGAGFTLTYSEEPHWILKEGTSLIIYLSGGYPVTGFAQYRLKRPSEIR